MNKEQLLRDPNIKPDNDNISKCLNTSYNTYNKFIEELKKIDVSLMEWRYYNDGKSWLSKGEYKWVTSRGTNKVKSIFWLSIWDGFFKLSFYFSNGMQEELLKIPVSDETKELIKNSNPMGKTMRFIPLVLDIYNDRQLKDVVLLANFKKEN